MTNAKLVTILSIFLTLAAVPQAFAGAHASSGKYSDNSELEDAWLDGKLETAYLLNQHLNPFSIETDVQNGVVTLSGNVSSDIDRDLAVEIAKGVSGTRKVVNNLEIKSNSSPEKQSDEKNRRSFGQHIDDMTTTAAIKSKLLANSNTSGLDINVDTYSDVVTLTGKVSSSEEKDLAGQIAANQRNVATVENKLAVAN